MSKIRYGKQLLIMAAIAGILAALLVVGSCSSNSTTTATYKTPTSTTPIMTLPPTTLTTTATTTMTMPPTDTNTPPPTSSNTPTASKPAGQPVVINLIAKSFAFNMKTITVPAGAGVTINFDNQDTVPHNFALYTDSSASQSIYVGKVINMATTVYTFTAPTTPGTYFFRCDIHPTAMTGSFIVQ